MRLSCVLFLCCLAVQTILAAESNLALTVGRVTYSNVTFGVVTPSTLTIRHSFGIERISWSKLPAEIQERFGYGPVVDDKKEAARVKHFAELEVKLATEEASRLGVSPDAVAKINRTGQIAYLPLKKTLMIIPVISLLRNLMASWKYGTRPHGSMVRIAG